MNTADDIFMVTLKALTISLMTIAAFLVHPAMGIAMVIVMAMFFRKTGRR